jgi:predicted GIY-YIG superfamily endonuclease
MPKTDALILEYRIKQLPTDKKIAEFIAVQNNLKKVIGH